MTSAAELLASLPPIGIPSKATSPSESFADEPAPWPETPQGPHAELNMLRPASPYTWATCKLDQGRLLHPSWPSFHTPGELFPVLRPWGATISAKRDPWGQFQGWSSLTLDERGRLHLPTYLRKHLGTTSTGTLITAVADEQLHLIAPTALEEALNLTPYMTEDEQIEAAEAHAKRKDWKP